MIIAYDKLDVATNQLTEIQQVNQQLQMDVDLLKYNLDSLSTLSSIYDLEDTKIYVMKPTRRNTINSVVIIVWDKSNNKIYLDIKHLPNSSPGKKYVLWGITQIGREIDLGSFVHTGKSQTIELEGMRDAIRFIITQEMESGVKFPTMSKVYNTTNVY